MVAATGIGAGDMIAASVAGSRYGLIILWTVIIGGILKFALNEGLARWHLATESTLIEGWIKKLPKGISIYFMIFLVFWSFLVAGALISFCGLVANTIFPLPISDKPAIAIWGGLHSIAAIGLIYLGGYQLLENIMKLFIAIMFFVVVVCAILVCPSWSEALLSMFIPSIPSDPKAITFILALIGGVGGSVTILCYSYWLQEKHDPRTFSQSAIRFDLGVAYGMTVLFGMAIIIIAAGVSPESITGYGMILSLANELGNTLGVFGKWAFLLGFWGAVFSSMLGVWSGVPYLFADIVRQYKSKMGETSQMISIRSKTYSWFLVYLAIPPIFLVFIEKPVWIAIAYSVTGAFFMPFLAGILLYMNNQRKWVGKYVNTWVYNVLLLAGLVLFTVLLGRELIKHF